MSRFELMRFQYRFYRSSQKSVNTCLGNNRKKKSDCLTDVKVLDHDSTSFLAPLPLTHMFPESTRRSSVPDSRSSARGQTTAYTTATRTVAAALPECYAFSSIQCLTNLVLIQRGRFSTSPSNDQN